MCRSWLSLCVAIGGGIVRYSVIAVCTASVPWRTALCSRVLSYDCHACDELIFGISLRQAQIDLEFDSLSVCLVFLHICFFWLLFFLFTCLPVYLVCCVPVFLFARLALCRCVCI